MPTRAIKAIFFTRFHHEKGSRVLHQVPEGSITPSTSSSALSAPLFDFDSVTTYIIPTQQFCDRLITFCTNHHRVIGYPVCVREGKYSRNEYIFNFAVVIDEEIVDWAAYSQVVRKLGRLLRGLEEQGGFLSREEEGVVEDDPGCGIGVAGPESLTGLGSKVYALCEVVLEDLNNYAECMIPIDDSNTINLKLFPAIAPPPPIHSYQVPLLTISLSSLSEPVSSDLTLTRIIPYIDGINSVHRISQLADTDLSLTRKALQHLAYYGCLVLLDIFQFSAIYAPTADIGAFVMEKSVQEECARYVRIPRPKGLTKSINPTSSESSHTRSSASHTSLSSLTSEAQLRPSSPPQSHSTSNLDTSFSSTTSSDPPDISPMDLITLYTSLRQGLPLKTWVLENLPLLQGIDIRRFITFGLIKGFLYRVHRYAIATSNPISVANNKRENIPPAPPTSLESEPETLTTPTPHFEPGSLPTITTTTTPEPHRRNTTLHHKPSIASTILSNTNSRATDSMPSSIPHHLSHNLSHTHGHNVQNPGYVESGSEKRFNGSQRGHDAKNGGGLQLLRFLDGMHSFDEICTEVEGSERVVEERVRGLGDVGFFWR